MEYEVHRVFASEMYKALLGKEIIPEEITPLADDASNKTAWDAKVRERNKQIVGIKENNNTVWCDIASALHNNGLLYIRHDSNSVASTTTKIFKRRKTNCGMSSLSEYFIRAQELMSRIAEAGLNISETLCNALVINELPEKYERFIVQESFSPANVPEIQTRLQSNDDSRLQRSQAKEDSATVMDFGNTSGRGE